MSYEVCNEYDLRSIKYTDSNELSLDNDVFHIIGRPDEVYDLYSYYKFYPNTIGFYDLITNKGGKYVKKSDSPNITCVIVGSRPSKKAISSYLGKVKLIRAEDAYKWLNSVACRKAECQVIEKDYNVSVDKKLRPYQQDLKDKVFNLWKSYYNIMLQLPTGTGKTVLFTSIINDLTKVEDTKIVILAHRKELIDQISEHLSRYHIEHGLIVSGRIRKPELSVQVASVQTLTHPNNIPLLEELKPKFIIIDEAHHSLADSYTKFWNLCGNCWKLGVTATPYRLNLRSFSSHFDKLVESNPITFFINQGYLSQYDFLSDNPKSNLSRTIKAIKEKSTTGDYKIDTLLRELNIEEHIQRLIICYEQYVNGKKGIVYAINKEHAKNICNAYQAIGVKAVYIDSDTPKRERKTIVDEFRKTNIKVMVNVDIFSEGFDCPDVEFIQLARPTWSLSKYLQQVGRGMRPSEKKEKTVILDNSRMYIKFGLPSEKRPWKNYFDGESYLKSYQGHEDEINEKILNRLSKDDKELMIKIDLSTESELYKKYTESEDPFGEKNNDIFTKLFKEDGKTAKKIFWWLSAAIIIIYLILKVGIDGLLGIFLFICIIAYIVVKV